MDSRPYSSLFQKYTSFYVSLFVKALCIHIEVHKMIIINMRDFTNHSSHERRHIHTMTYSLYHVQRQDFYNTLVKLLN